MSYQTKIRNYVFNFGESLNQAGHYQLVKIMNENIGAFVKNLYAGCRFSKEKFKIVTLKKTPDKKSARLSKRDNSILRDKINELMRSGIVERCESLWSSPVSIRFIDGIPEINIDYTDLNRHTVYDAFPFPSKKEVINSIKPSSLFSIIVLKDPYYQLELTEKSKQKTAFATDFGCYQFTTMNRHLKNSHKYLKSALETAFATNKDLDLNSIVFYHGEILIFTDESDGHFEIIDQLLKSLRNCNLKVDDEASYFATKECEFLNFLISEKGIGVAPSQLLKIENFRSPENKSQLKYFLELIKKHKEFYEYNYGDNYQTLTDSFYQLINNKTYSNIVNDWNQELEDEFQELKQKLTNCKPIPFGKFIINNKEKSDQNRPNL